MKRVILIVFLLAEARIAGCAKQQAHSSSTNSAQRAKSKLDLTTVDMGKTENQPTYQRYRSDSTRLPRSASR